MVFNATIAIILVGASMLGALQRTILPYLRKAKAQSDDNGKKLKFDKSYILTLFLSVSAAIPSVYIILRTVLPDLPSDESMLTTFFMSYATAFTTNDQVNDIVAR